MTVEFKGTFNVLHTEWSGGLGGQELRIIHEMVAMRTLGVNVYLACTPHAEIGKKATQYGISVFHLPFRGNADLKTLFGLLKIIRQHHINIVNTHSGKDTWVGGVAAKLSGAKFIRTRHLSNRINPSRLNFINELADHVITTGSIIKNEMIAFNRINPKKITSIPSGVDINRFNSASPSLDKQKWRKHFRIAEGEIAIGMIAVLRSWKRHDLLIKAFSELWGSNKKIKLFIAGDGPQRQNIERILENTEGHEQITLLGHLEKPEELLAALDIFVLPSDGFEGVPQSIIQALMMEKAVIATNTGSVSDLYQRDNFLMVKPGDYKALYYGLESLVSNLSERVALEAKAKHSVIDEFSQKAMCGQLNKIYHSLFNKSAAA